MPPPANNNKETPMIVSAWCNGHHCYGIKIDIDDRDKYFSRRWKQVRVKIADQPEKTFGLSPSFWCTCVEIRNVAFRDWLDELGYVKNREKTRKWKSEPPEFLLTPLGSNRFHLTQRP